MKNILNRTDGLYLILPIINPVLKKSMATVAYHEAGHAIAGLFIGGNFKYATINRETGSGEVSFGDRKPNHDELIAAIPPEILKEVTIDDAMVSYAGIQAEFILAGINPTGPCDYNEQDDKDVKFKIMRSHGLCHANFYIQQRARECLLKNWAAVEELANELLKKGKVTIEDYERMRQQDQKQILFGSTDTKS